MNKTLLYIVGLIVIALGGYYLFSQQTTSSPPETDTKTKAEPVTTDVALSNPLTFDGTLPCADCAGIDTTIILNPDNTFITSEVYQGKNDDEPFVTNGTWEEQTGTPSDPDATVYALRSDNGDVSYYLTQGETLTVLDQDKNTIDSPFDMTLILQE